MADADDLTLAYLASHPTEAARVLETLPRAASVALLARIPARIGAPVLEALPSSSAAEHLAGLEREQATALLTGTRIQNAAAALRHMASPVRDTLLHGLPTQRAVACRLLLAYPDTSVGAWADPDVVDLQPDSRVEEAIIRLREKSASDIGDGVYVIDSASRLLGVVPLAVLFRAPGHVRLAGVMRPPRASLSAAMSVTTALRLAAWEESLSLPVIDGRERLMGHLSRGTLLASVSHRRARNGAGGTLIEVLAANYWILVSGFLAAAVSLLPAATPVSRVRG